MNTKHITSILVICISILAIQCTKKQEEKVEPSQKIMFDDQYNESETFLESEFIDVYSADGNLYIDYKNDDPNLFYRYYYYYDLRFNYTIETSIAPINNPDNFNYGVMFMVKNTYNHYYFYIRQNQFYIGYVYNQNHHTISDYLYSEHINIDGTPNTIKIYKGSNHLKFWINDHEVFECDFTNEIGDQFGYRLNQAGTVAIDYVNIYEAE